MKIGPHRHLISMSTLLSAAVPAAVESIPSALRFSLAEFAQVFSLSSQTKGRCAGVRKYHEQRG